MERKLKILVVVENLASCCGANVNILVNLVEKMNKKANIHVLSKTNSLRPIDNEKSKKFNKCIAFVSSEGESLTEFQTKHNWKNIGAFKKMLLLISHPRIMAFLFDVKYFDSTITEKKYKDNIARVCEEEDYDVVVGVCAPYYIAKAIAQANIKVYKAIIQLDPYTWNHTLPKSLFRIRKTIEKNVIKKLNHVFAVSFVYDELTVKKLINENKATSFNVPGILVDEDNEKASSLNFDEKRQIDFVFIGQFYDKIRSPKYLLELFTKLPHNYVLHIYGGGAERIIKEYETKLGERLQLHGWVSAEIAKEQMGSADFLINVNNTITNQMSSKLIEYIGTGRPIINLCKFQNCPSRKYVSKYDNCLTIVEQDIISNTQIESFCAFVEDKKGKTDSTINILNSFQNCTDKYVADLIMTVLEDCRERQND